MHFDLEPGQAPAPIGVRISVGTSSYCATFGRTLKADGTMFEATAAGGIQPCE